MFTLLLDVALTPSLMYCQLQRQVSKHDWRHLLIFSWTAGGIGSSRYCHTY